MSVCESITADSDLLCLLSFAGRPCEERLRAESAESRPTGRFALRLQSGRERGIGKES